MKWIKSLTLLSIVVILLFIGILFAIHNRQIVAVDLIFVQLSEKSVALWILISFTMGMLIGFITSGMTIIYLKSQLALLKRQQKNQQKPVDKPSVEEPTKP